MTITKCLIKAIAILLVAPLYAGSDLDFSSDMAEGRTLVQAGAQAFRDDNLLEAERLLRRGIIKMRGALGPQDPALVDHYILLGMTLQSLERHGDALDELTRAQHLVHLEGGLLDPKQQEIVYAKLESLEKLDEYWTAEQSFRALVRLNQARFGEADTRTIEATVAFGNWLTRVGLYRSAISHFRQSIERLENAVGGEHPGMVAYHVARGRAYFSEGTQQQRGLTSIGRAVAIMERTASHFQPEHQVELLISYADTLMRFRREKPAVEQFRKAWKVAQEHPESPSYSAWIAKLGANRWVRYGHFWPLDKNPTGPAIAVSFRVNDEGRPIDIAVASPFNRMTESAIKRVFRNTRFQPMIVDGEAIESTTEQELLITFPRRELWQAPPRYEPIFGAGRLSGGG